MAISLRNLRDASLENTSGPTFEFKLAFVMLYMGQNTIIRMTVTWMIILIAHFALVWKQSWSTHNNHLVCEALNGMVS